MQHDASRRQFLRGGPRQAGHAVRPPWALAEPDFIARCDSCDDACRERLIRPGSGPDCHVPKEWHHKVVRKVRATNELYHKALGTIDTKEKFEEKRLELAQNVWRAMKATDSRECRNCHDFESMDFTAQGRRAVTQHSKAVEQGQTCIDCHKGIAHALPDMRDVNPTATVGRN